LSAIDDIRPPNSNKQSDRTVKNVRRGRVLHIDARTGSITHSIERNWQGVSIEHDRSGRGNFQDSIIAIAHDRQAKRQVWTWQPKFKLDENTLTIDGDRLFILANVPRWRIISGAID
jgi:hypothetical protein